MTRQTTQRIRPGKAAVVGKRGLRWPGPGWIRCLALALAPLLFLTIATAQAPSLQDTWKAANAALAEGRYAESARLYTNLPTQGKTSAALEYNRGLADSRLGESGRANAHWQLARRLEPRNPAILAALQHSTPGGTASTPGGPVAILAWTDFLTLNEWGILAVIVVWIWGGLLLIGRLKPGTAPALRGYTLACGLAAVIVTGLLAGAWARRARLPDAIALRPDVVVRVSPLEEARPAFTLSEGQRVLSRPAQGAWLMIEDPQTRRMGWARAEHFLRLPLR